MDTSTAFDYDRYMRTAKECKKAIRKAKKKFETNIAKNGNKKSKTKSRVTVGPLKQGDDMFTDNRDMATILNDQFGTVFMHEDPNTAPTCPDTWGGFKVENILFDEETVRKKA